MTVKPERYEVFARRQPLDPLRHLGGVTATNTELAYVYALTIFDEEKWRDVAVVLRRDIYSMSPILG
jgi:1,2-phenylacetyl-CoA epoxidase PaaB subunit